MKSLQAFEKIFKKSQKRPFFQRSLGVGVGSCDTVVGESNRTHMIPSMVHQGRAANSQLRGSYIPRSNLEVVASAARLNFKRNHYFKNQAEIGQIASRRDHAATTSKHAHNAHPSGIPF